MICCLFGIKPLPETIYCQLESEKSTSLKFKARYELFLSRECTWNCYLLLLFPAWNIYTSIYVYSIPLTSSSLKIILYRFCYIFCSFIHVDFIYNILVYCIGLLPNVWLPSTNETSIRMSIVLWRTIDVIQCRFIINIIWSKIFK